MEIEPYRPYCRLIRGLSMIKNLSKKKVLARHVEVRRDWKGIEKGLMLTKKKDFKDKGLVFIFYMENILTFHTFFMHFPVDVLFLDKKSRVRKVLRQVKPWRVHFAKAKYVVELEAGKALNTSVGDRISFK